MGLLSDEEQVALMRHAVVFQEKAGDRKWVALFVPNEYSGPAYEVLATKLCDELHATRKDDTRKQTLYDREERKDGIVTVARALDHLADPSASAYTDRAIVLECAGQEVPPVLAKTKKKLVVADALDRSIKDFVATQARDLIS